MFPCPLLGFKLLLEMPRWLFFYSCNLSLGSFLISIMHWSLGSFYNRSLTRFSLTIPSSFGHLRTIANFAIVSMKQYRDSSSVISCFKQWGSMYCKSLFRTASYTLYVDHFVVSPSQIILSTSKKPTTVGELIETYSDVQYFGSLNPLTIMNEPYNFILRSFFPNSKLIFSVSLMYNIQFIGTRTSPTVIF